MLSRSREGAWIEIPADDLRGCRRYRRSREGAWIEILLVLILILILMVAPARERGLKFRLLALHYLRLLSLPRGSVD